MNILFVCRGNTCRSVLAQYIAISLQKRLSPMANEHVFRSAGIDAWTGQPASNHALAILASQYHVDAESHRAYRLNDELVAWADLIYTMTPERASQICERFPATGQKLKLLDERVPFEDPIGGSSEEYRQLAHLIETALMKHISQLEIL